jgi:putative NIF3 family GTP cyclohydrolase 1 type 2
VGAGSGSKLLNNLNVDMIITGEFSHHEILHEVHRGVSVIVTDHSNTERFYLSIFKNKFINMLKNTTKDICKEDEIEIIVSEKDKDPLDYV